MFVITPFIDVCQWFQPFQAIAVLRNRPFGQLPQLGLTPGHIGKQKGVGLFHTQQVVAPVGGRTNHQVGAVESIERLPEVIGRDGQAVATNNHDFSGAGGKLRVESRGHALAQVIAGLEFALEACPAVVGVDKIAVIHHPVGVEGAGNGLRMGQQVFVYGHGPGVADGAGHAGFDLPFNRIFNENNKVMLGHAEVCRTALVVVPLRMKAGRQKHRPCILTMSKQIVYTDQAPAPIGPYSQAVLVNGTLYVSGQVAIELAPQGDIQAETQKVMENIGAILKAAGMDYANVAKATIFVKDMNNFAAINAVYGQFFTSNPPARETVEVARLPKDVNVEISVIAIQ